MHRRGLLAAGGALLFAPRAEAQTRRPQRAAEPPPYAVEPLTVVSRADSAVLSGTLTRPRDAQPAPAVLLLGVAGPNDRDLAFAGHAAFETLADRLTRAGLAVLRLDDRGVGGSGGDWSRAGYETLAQDAVSALDALGSTPGVDPQRLGVFGLSEGAAIAAMTAASSPDRVRALVMASPPGLPGEESLRRQLEAALAAAPLDDALRMQARRSFEAFIALGRQAARDPAELAGFAQALAGPMGLLLPPYAFLPREPEARARLFAGPWYQSQLDLQPSDILSRVRCPTLVIGGTLDRVLPPADHHPPVRQALAEAGVTADIRLFEGVSHLLQPGVTGLPDEYARIDVTIDPRVLDALEGWLKTAL